MDEQTSPEPTAGGRGRRRLGRWAGAVALLGVVPVEFFAVMVGIALADGQFGVDMKVLLLSAEAIASGASPYLGLTYPPTIPFALVPFTVVPAAPEVLGFLALGAVVLSLWLLEVRDWRCYGALLLWAPVYSGVQTANPTLFLVLLAALAWRHRHRGVLGGIAAGVAIAAKLISAPLAVWLVATRRAATGAISIVVAAGLTGLLLLVIVLALDRTGSTGFLEGLSAVPGAGNSPSYSIIDTAASLGLGRVAGYVLTIVAVAAACAASAWTGRRGDDRRSFAFAAIATLVAAPNVWLHSFAFLLLAVAVLRPRFGVVWLVPALLYAVPVDDPSGPEVVVGWVLAGVIALLALAPYRSPTPTRARTATEPSI